MPQDQSSVPVSDSTHKPSVQPVTGNGDAERLRQRVEERRAELGIVDKPDVTVGSVIRERGLSLPPIVRETDEQKRHRESRERLRAEAEAEGNWERIVRSIGERYRDCTLENYEVSHAKQEAAFSMIRGYASDLSKNVKDGMAVVLFGTVGTGKDHLMAALMRKCVFSHISVQWLNGMEFFGEMRDRISEEKSERDVVRDLAKPDVLAISDPLPPFGNLTQFQAAMFFRVIDRRYRDRKATWITVNVANSEEASAKIGMSVIDRMKERSVAVHCDWPSYRTRKQ